MLLFVQFLFSFRCTVAVFVTTWLVRVVESVAMVTKTVVKETEQAIILPSPDDAEGRFGF